MRLDLRFTARPLKELWCQAIIALLFQEPVDGADTVHGLDSKTLGFLTYLREKGFWTGAKGDILLLASQDMVKADKILLKGLGDRAVYNTEVLVEMIGEIGESLGGMALSEIGIHFPAARGAGTSYPAQVQAACIHLVDSFLPRYEDTSDFVLKLIFSVEGAFMGMLETALGGIRASLSSRLDLTIVMD